MSASFIFDKTIVHENHERHENKDELKKQFHVSNLLHSVCQTPSKIVLRFSFRAFRVFRGPGFYLIGVSDNAVAKWIREGKISRENVGNLARVLQMSPNEFIGGMEITYPAHPDPKINAMMKIMEQMGEYQKDTLMKIGTALTESESKPGKGTH